MTLSPQGPQTKAVLPQPNRVPLFLCVAIFALAMLLIHPVVESGILDDWSILRTAQLLAQTGHIQYNGWEAPILGWPLYAGALMFKLFGFSFTAGRLAIMFTALATVALFQCLLVRFGIKPWLATLGALTMGLSPVFLMTSVLFMTDVPGTLAVLCCLYGCVRALQSSEDKVSGRWLMLAAGSNAVLGTARQISWLGLLVMVPCTVWLLRRRRKLVLTGALAWLGGVSFLAVVMLWFSHQPYVLPEHLLPGRISLASLHRGAEALVRVLLDCLLLILPIPMLFWGFTSPHVRSHRFGLVLVSALTLLLAVALGTHRLSPQHVAPFLLFPTDPQCAENTFLSIQMPIHGLPPNPFVYKERALMTMFVFLAAVGVVRALPMLKLAWQRDRSAPEAGITWLQTMTLLVPFTLGYLLLLLPRAMFIFTVDRYVVFLLPIGVLLLLKLASAATQQRSVLVGTIALGMMGLYSIATLHDAFATYRAALAGTQELQAAGVPREAISAGMEYNHWTELQHSINIPNQGVRLPGGLIDRGRPDPEQPGPCMQFQNGQTPSVHARYAIDYAGTLCQVATEFPPIHFTAWLPPVHRSAVIIHYTPGELTPRGGL